MQAETSRCKERPAGARRDQQMQRETSQETSAGERKNQQGQVLPTSLQLTESLQSLVAFLQ